MHVAEEGPNSGILHPAPEHKRLPPERFYWALLDASPLSGGPSSAQLGYLFESVLPCPIEELHAAYACLPGRRFIACAMRREILASEAVGAITLCPQRVPAFIDEECDPQRLNLLAGAFEPAPVTRLKRDCLACAAALALACAAVLSLGLEARARDFREHALEVREARLSVYAQVLGESDGSAPGGPALRMLAELRQLRQTRAPGASSELDHTDDAASGLADLLAHWPEDPSLPVQTEHISVTPEGITLRALLPTSADAQRLAENFRGFGGWQLQQPQVTSAREHVQVALRFAARKEAHE